MKKEVERVSVVRCRNYKTLEVNEAIVKTFHLAKIKIPFHSKVLIKPNFVGWFGKNQEAITTNLAIIEAVCKILRGKKCRIFIGESSFTDTAVAFKKLGIEKLAKKYNAKIVIFEQDKFVKIFDRHAKVLKSFRISKTLKDTDIVINIPKLKTHQLTKFTGAIKNLYGCIPGGIKQAYHAHASNEKKFSNLLIDIYQNIKPQINIMDAVIGMEGKGPTSGNPIKVGFILASRNAVALDVAASKMIGYNPKDILMLREAVRRKLGDFNFKVVGMDKLPIFDFDKPYVQRKLSKKLAGFFKEKPIVVDEYKCIRCGLCSRKCPMKAITLMPFPTINRKKCIRCFCCMEICPRHALSLKE